MGNEEAFAVAAARAEAEEERSMNVSEYLRLCHQGSKELNSGKQKAAMKTLKKAIKLEPMNPAAHHNIGHAYLLQGDFLLSHQAFVAALECDRQVPAALLPAHRGAARAGTMYQAWMARAKATPCGSRDVFCECDACASLPDKPVWMCTKDVLLETANRAILVSRDDDALWFMRASLLQANDKRAAAESFTRASIIAAGKGKQEARNMYAQRAAECFEALPPPTDQETAQKRIIDADMLAASMTSMSSPHVSGLCCPSTPVRIWPLRMSVGLLVMLAFTVVAVGIYVALYDFVAPFGLAPFCLLAVAAPRDAGEGDL